MDRSSTFRSQRPAAVRTARAAALDLLLPAAAGERRAPASVAEARRVVPGSPVFRQSSHGCHAGSRAHAYPATDADSGDRSAVSKTESEPSGKGPRDLSVLVARRLDRTAQPSLEHRYYIPSNAWRLPLFGGCDGLVQPVRTQLGTVQHHGDRLLSGGVGGRLPLRATGDLELRSGFAVHRDRVSGAAEKAWRIHQHGWTRACAGQCVHRAPMAQS